MLFVYFQGKASLGLQGFKTFYRGFNRQYVCSNWLLWFFYTFWYIYWKYMRQSKYSHNFCMNLSIKTPATIIIYLPQRTSQNYCNIQARKLGVGGCWRRCLPWAYKYNKKMSRSEGINVKRVYFFRGVGRNKVIFRVILTFLRAPLLLRIYGPVNILVKIFTFCICLEKIG